jgi:hypothetical protein
MSDARKPQHVGWKPTRVENFEVVKCCVTGVLNVMTYTKVEKGKRIGRTALSTTQATYRSRRAHNQCPQLDSQTCGH